MAAVYQCQLSVPSVQGWLISTTESWWVNGYTTRCASPISVVVSWLRLVPGGGLIIWRSALSHGPTRLGKGLYFTTRTLHNFHEGKTMNYNVYSGAINYQKLVINGITHKCNLYSLQLWRTMKHSEWIVMSCHNSARSLHNIRTVNLAQKKSTQNHYLANLEVGFTI